jgi:hypothetical protein
MMRSHRSVEHGCRDIYFSFSQWWTTVSMEQSFSRHCTCKCDFAGTTISCFSRQTTAGGSKSVNELLYIICVCYHNSMLNELHQCMVGCSACPTRSKKSWIFWSFHLLADVIFSFSCWEWWTSKTQLQHTASTSPNKQQKPCVLYVCLAWITMLSTAPTPVDITLGEVVITSGTSKDVYQACLNLPNGSLAMHAVGQMLLLWNVSNISDRLIQLHLLIITATWNMPYHSNRSQN